jgi:hypothetical protein
MKHSTKGGHDNTNEGVSEMSEPRKKGPLERLASVLEAAQFTNGSLDITLSGPEMMPGCPLKVVLYLQGEEIKNLSAQLSGVAVALQDIANAIRETKK